MADNPPRATHALEIKKITTRDIADILKAGFDDFRAAARYCLFFGGIYAIGGWLLILLLFHFDMPYLVYPLAVGFALIAPFIAGGFYFISHQLEEKQPLNWAKTFAVVRSMFERDLGWMALVTGFSLFIWLDIAAFLTFSFFGFKLFTLPELIHEIMTTSRGLIFLLVGNTAGVLISFVVFSYSAVSFPLLYHRDIDFITALITSVKLVIKNPLPMALWCATIAVLIAVSLLTGLLALFVVLPVLGHATWHLYRKAIGPTTL
ncbi:DUF2189 domain-containing protein [Kiloniella laminariae]|uniref:DUF2189 domain-containing protein n=1 Tax=Kiloniella laminariae TaxID=454162 RepID=A0ABT4LEV9_9PROT|nr:DUF2189 domain-containing protein [Kiloniella laminariae]MCZ4279629.1 DUF2189 domain-containing protein [Kiloniella laminariae]